VTDGRGAFRLIASPRVTTRRRSASSTSRASRYHRIDRTTRLCRPAPVVERTTVTGSDVRQPADVENPENLVDIAGSPSRGASTAQERNARPLRPAGEVLETVPGVVISQHSGEGKANQYYLRGFNLDHGTDLATTVAGMPVNMPTHAHGQGYSDLSFLIPSW
jgi:hypothetical protein